MNRGKVGQSSENRGGRVWRFQVQGLKAGGFEILVVFVLLWFNLCNLVSD